MRDLRERFSRSQQDRESIDPLSEKLVIVVVFWIAAAVLLPLHVLFVYGLFFTKPAFGIFGLLVAFGLPLAVVDFFGYRWFRDNYSVFRWINRSDDSHGDGSSAT